MAKRLQVIVVGDVVAIVIAHAEEIAASMAWTIPPITVARGAAGWQAYGEQNGNPGCGWRIADFRLDDLREWHVVIATCGECRHMAELSRSTLTYRRWSARLRLADLQPKLRCRQCGARGGHAINVYLKPRG